MKAAAASILGVLDGVFVFAIYSALHELGWHRVAQAVFVGMAVCVPLLIVSAVAWRAWVLPRPLGTGASGIL